MSNFYRTFYAEKFNLDLFLNILFTRNEVKVFLLDLFDFFDNNTEKKSLLKKISLKVFKDLRSYLQNLPSFPKETGAF